MVNELPKRELNRLDIEEVFELLKNEIQMNKESFNNVSDELNDIEKNEKKLDEKIKKQIEENNNIDKFEKLLEIRKKLEEKKEYIDNQKTVIEKNQKILSIVIPKEEKVLSFTKEVSKFEKDIQDLNKIIEKEKEKERLNKTKEKKLEKLKKIFSDYELFCENKKELEIEKSKIAELEETKLEIDEAIKIYENVSKEYKQLNLKYIEEEDRFFKEQAGILSEKLKDGEPCPVCGSIEHPCKAKKSDNLLSKEMLDELKQECEKKCEQNNIIKNKITEMNSKYEVLLSKIDENIKEKFDLKKYSSFIERKLVDCLNKIEKLELDCSKIYFEIFGEDFEISSFDYDNLKKNFEKLVKSDKENLIKNQTLLKDYIFQKKNKGKDLEKAEKDYEKAYMSLGYENEREFKEKVWNKLKIKQVEKEIETYNNNVTENKIKILELEKKVKSKEKVDIEKDKILLLEIQKSLKEKKKQFIDNKGILDNNRRMNLALKNTSEELLKKIDEFVIYDELSRTSAGMLTGKRRIEFEQYVQTAYFDMIINEANKRFSKMTDGRYLLIRREVAEKISDRMGLDLEVIDNYNGKKRDVKSLSGGESFKAALSLALGLSDVIQSYSGGIVVDTLFIDEGFGSLDAESREQAIVTLNSLIEGNKLIGIISHVTELKDRIDKKIVVTKTSNRKQN